MSAQPIEETTTAPRLVRVTAPARSDADTLRSQLLGAASRLTISEGWSKVTMSRLADEVGVSRQTVYNEFGSKPALAQQLVLGELQVFLGRVFDGFEASPSDPVGAIHGAALNVLRLSLENPLLHAVIAGSHGAESELLPLLTTDSEALLTLAKEAITEGMLRFELRLTRAQLDVGVDVVVRTVLSHVIHPSGTPEETAAGIAWIASVVLGLDDQWGDPKLRA
ncbi:TetR/AcrR family transcriptional regulator [Flexivirga meconopsidis]|uniref:TetR/AcrR family transcriptional regulator n=1 Tax=Flexivirga meconopsidis TaxID=2977121 RepID=UPI002240AE68|nr:TetR family transcriptional regulator [Flexivirga meconopsidis]